MFFGRRTLLVILVFALSLFLAACQEKTENSSAGIFPIFGSPNNSNSTIIAKVGHVEISQRDLDMRFDELVPRIQKKYIGDEGKQLLLKEMIDETLLVLAAMDMGLQNHEDVARTLVTQRRLTIVNAMRNIGIPDMGTPTEDELQAFFKDNRKEFMQESMVHTRHVECFTQKNAEAAYKLLEADLSPRNFMKVAAEYSVNDATLGRDADLGWYNKTGVVANMKDSDAFISATYDLPIGLHSPILVVDRWHIVQVLERRSVRPMTYNEARDLVKQLMLPAFFDGKIKDFTLAARKTTSVEMFDKFAPGKGLSPELLMKRAAVTADPGDKLDYYRLIYSDFPNSEKADDALFMCALISVDTWRDRRVAERYLNLLLEHYPESELVDDVTYLKENLYKPGGLDPVSIEDLRKN